MKTAILGVWHVHAPAYAKTAAEHGEVLGFFERNDALAAAFAEKTGLYRFPTRKALLASGCEGVIVCSATCDHEEDIVAAAEAGKHIFTEKVLALSDAACERIAAAVETAGVRFVISLFQKYLGSRIAVKRIADSGELGRINYLRFRNCHSGSTQAWLPDHFYSARECGGGAMIDLGAHGMYLAEWILGLPIAAASVFTVACNNERVRAQNTDGVEDNAVTLLHYEGGAIAVNETGFVSNRDPVVFEVHGEDGYVRMVNNAVYKATAETGGAEVAVTPEADAPAPLVQFLTEDIREGCGIREACALTRMMTLAYSNVK